MLLKRTNALSSEIFFKIEVIDGAVAFLLKLGFSMYRPLCLEMCLLRACSLKNSNITPIRIRLPNFPEMGKQGRSGSILSLSLFRTNRWIRIRDSKEKSRRRKQEARLSHLVLSRLGVKHRFLTRKKNVFTII